MIMSFDAIQLVASGDSQANLHRSTLKELTTSLGPSHYSPGQLLHKPPVLRLHAGPTLRRDHALSSKHGIWYLLPHFRMVNYPKNTHFSQLPIPNYLLG